jgi:hypothetical protein
MPTPARILSTPISHLLRGKVTGAGSYKSVINGSNLPPELADYAKTVVRKTGLRRAERMEAAEHIVLCLLQDLEVEPDATAVRLAQPPARQVAKLLRKEIVARRGWAGRLMARLRRKISVSVGVFLLIYALQFYRFYFQRPQVKRNFAAEFNATIANIPDSDRAWDLIRRLGPITPDDEPLKHLWGEVWPEEEAWPKYADYVASRAQQVAMIREASRRKVLGFYISSEQIQLEADQVFKAQVLPGPDDNPLVLAWLLPYAGKIRACTRLLMADARVAASQGDGRRAAEDIRAIVRLATLVNQPPINIAELVGIASMVAAGNTALDLIERYPGLFGDQQLAEMADEFNGFAGGGRLAPHYGYDLNIVEDLVQRCYTDDGNGDGHFCGVGLSNMDQMADPPNQFGPWPYILGPLNMHRFASRKQLMDRARNIMALHEDFAACPLWKRTADLGTIIAESQPKATVVFLMLLGDGLRMHADCMETATLQRDAFVTTLALERYRLRHGAFPGSLDELVPEFMAAVPIDRFSGGPLKYRLEESRPLLYSVGSDRDDDGGRAPAHPYEAMKVFKPEDQGSAPDGDWVLWPRPREPVTGGQ